MKYKSPLLTIVFLPAFLFIRAAVCYYKSTNLLELYNDPLTLAAVYNDLGKLYRKIGPYSRSHEFYNRAMSIYRQAGDKSGIATIYNESGVLDEYEGKFDDAIKNYRASLEIKKQLNDQAGIAYSLNFIAGVYAQMKNFTEAEAYNTQVLHIREQLKDSFTIALTYTYFGSIYSMQGNLKKAEESILKANAIVQSLGYRDLLRNNYTELSSIADKAGDYKKSLAYFKLAAALKDSIYKTETNRQVEELSAKYETTEKEKQIQQQQFEITKRNYWIVAITGVLLLSSLPAYSFYRRHRLKQQAQLQATIMQQQDIATKAVIEAEERERKRIASELHDGVGQMMSAARMNLSAIKSNLLFADPEQENNFDHITSLIDESCQEVRTVSHNMMPNALLKTGLGAALREFIEKVNNQVLKINFYTEGLNDRINANTETMLYRVVQECVNNVIKHSGASLLDISLIKDADGISATIEDNGQGFNATDISKFEGIGLKNIKSRISFLKGTIEWNSAPGSGTLVAIHIPA
ncbi:ATP-binding protein [soil metagenome]